MSLTNCDPIAFVATADRAATRTFYSDVLSLALVVDEPSALVYDAHGIMLRVSILNEYTPAPFTVLGWNVPNIRAELAALAERGVAFEHFEGFGQDASGVAAFPNGDQVAWFKDPSGNMLSLSQFAT